MNIIFMNKGLYCNLSGLIGAHTIDLTTGGITKHPHTVTLEMRYNWSKWYIGAYFNNPFKVWRSSDLVLKDYETHSSLRTRHVSDPYGAISIGCRFNYGKKKHHFADMEVEDVNQTTISK